MRNIIELKVEQRFLPHNCEPIEVLEVDPVPLARKAVNDARRLHPDANILPEVICATIELSRSQDWVVQALTINVAHKIAREKEQSLMDTKLVKV